MSAARLGDAARRLAMFLRHDADLGEGDKIAMLDLLASTADLAHTLAEATCRTALDACIDRRCGCEGAGTQTTGAAMARCNECPVNTTAPVFDALLAALPEDDHGPAGFGECDP